MIHAKPSPETTNYVQSRIGIWMSFVCAVHCMATPVLFLITPTLASQVEGLDWIEWIAFGMALTMTLTQLLPEYQFHKKPQALKTAFGGLLAILFGLLTETTGMPNYVHIGLMVGGSIGMAFAFYKGHRLRHHARVV